MSTFITKNNYLLATLFILLTLINFGCQKEDETPLFAETEVNQENSEVILRWNSLFLELEKDAIGMRPNATARALAYIHLAGYEALQVGMPNYISNQTHYPELIISEELRPDNIDWTIALNAAYARVYKHFLYGINDEGQQQITALYNEILTDLDNRNTDLRQQSIFWGNYVAEQIIVFSLTDTSAEDQITEPQPLSYEPPIGTGYWTYSHELERALFPYWGTVRTFAITPAETSTVPPLEYSENPDSPFHNQMTEVYLANNRAKEEDSDELWIAEFWCDDVEGLMISPPARQLSIANQLIVQHNLNMEEALVLLLKTGFALNDAAAATWKYKYEYMLMRPSVYINEIIDPAYQTNLFRLVDWPNPTFPAYPSGHSCFAASAAGVFIDIFGNNTVFTDRTHEGREEFRGMPRTFSSFEQMAEENSLSRILLGVHAKMDCDEGLRLGYEIAAAVNALNISN